MRKFNNREKQIINKLTQVNLADTEYFSFFLQNSFFTTDSKTALFVLTKQKTILLYLKQEIFDNPKKKKEEIGKFFELLSLIIYLKENRYITIYSNPGAQEADLLVMREDFDVVSKEEESKVIFNNKGLHLFTNDIEHIYDSEDNIVFKAIRLEVDVYNLIVENFLGLLYVSEELVELTKRDFISEEDIKFKKQQKATWTSIIIAFLIGVLSIGLNINTNNKTKTNNKVLFDCIENNLNKNEPNFNISPLQDLNDSLK